MKIFSSFDTEYKRKIFMEKQEQYGKENVLLIERSKIFLYFKVIFPSLLGILIAILFFIILYITRETSLILSAVIGIFTLVMCLLLFRVIEYSIDYTMDYCIVTPNEILIAEQTGLFQRNVTRMDCEQVKSVYSKKLGVVQSILNNGSIVFLIDAADASSRGKITMNYIYEPEKKRKIIDTILTSLN